MTLIGLLKKIILSIGASLLAIVITFLLYWVISIGDLVLGTTMKSNAYISNLFILLPLALIGFFIYRIWWSRKNFKVTAEV